MTEKLLHGTNVVAALQQMGGEGVAKGVTGHALVETASADACFTALQDALVKVMAALQTAQLRPTRACRKDHYQPHAFGAVGATHHG
jgi:hypothetical protein